MKINPRYFGSRRYRTLYYLLPIFNGAMCTAGIEFTYGFLALPAYSPEFPEDFLGDLVVSILSMLYGISHGVVAGCLIAAVNLSILGRIYRRNFFTFLIAHWRHPGGENEPDRPFLVPMFLTLLGHVTVVWGVRLATGAPSGDKPGSVGIFIFVSLVYIFWVIPALVDGERKLGGLDRVNGQTDEAGA